LARVVLFGYNYYTMNIPEKRLHGSQALMFIPLLLVIFSCRQALKGPEAPLPAPEVLISRLPAAPPETFKGRGDFSLYWNGFSRGRFRGLLIYKRPGQMRLTLLGPMGITAYEVLFRRGRLVLLDPSRQEAWRWDTGMGEIFPSGEYLTGKELQVIRTAAGYSLHASGPDPTGPEEIYLFSGKDLIWTGSEYRLRDGKALRLEVDALKKGIPSRFSISLGSLTIEAAIEKFTFNREIEESAFTIPRGFTIKETEGAPF